MNLSVGLTVRESDTEWKGRTALARDEQSSESVLDFPPRAESYIGFIRVVALAREEQLANR